jgi:phosphoribosylformylglycinamidine cyclo-ligase
MMSAHEYDIAGTGVGIVDFDAILGRERVEFGDVVIAMRSSGLHSNGYSLVRHLLLSGAGRLRLESVLEELGSQRTLGEELLTPTRIYAKDCLALVTETEVRAFAHVTGGGIPGNLSRVLPENLDAIVDRATWRPQPIFELVQTKGRVDQPEMESTFNMGVGMFAIVAASDADRALAFLAARKVDAWQVGEVIEGSGMVRMVNSYTSG